MKENQQLVNNIKGGGTIEQKQKAASIALALVAVAWGTSYAIIKDTLNIIQPFSLMLIRFGLSAILLSIIYYKKLLYIRFNDIKRGSIIGIFMFCSFFTLVTGLQYTTASKQSFLIGSYVLLVPFLAWFVNKRKPDAYAVVGAVFATFGLALLTLGGNEGISGFNKGDIISLFCALSFALHMITIERYSKDSDPITLTIIQFIVTSILFFILTGLFESYNLLIILEIKFEIAYLVIITTVIAFVVQNVAQRFISSTSTALILTLESAIGSIFAVFYLHESMTFLMVFGCLIVFLGIITQETKLEFIKFKKSEM